MLSSRNVLAVSSASSVELPIPGESDAGIQASSDNSLISEFQSILAQYPSAPSAATSADITKTLQLNNEALPVEGRVLPDASPMEVVNHPAWDLLDVVNEVDWSVELPEMTCEHVAELSSALLGAGDDIEGDNDEQSINQGQLVEDALIKEMLVDDSEALVLTSSVTTLPPSLMPQLVTPLPSVQVVAEPEMDAVPLSEIEGAEAGLLDRDRSILARTAVFLEVNLAEGRQLRQEKMLAQHFADMPSVESSPVSKEMVANPGMSFDALLVQTTTGNHDGLDNVDRKDFEVGLVATPQTGDSRAPAESRSIKQALPSAVVMQLPSPVYKPEWVDQFHGRIRWMVDQQVSSAQVIIDPPELGPMQVDIARTADNGTQITFTVNNLAIKELLDANMLRFKSVLASGENPSVQVDVRQQQQQQEQRQGQASASQLELERRYPAAERSSDRSSNMRESYFIGRPKGLLDHYV